MTLAVKWTKVLTGVNWVHKEKIMNIFVNTYIYIFFINMMIKYKSNKLSMIKLYIQETRLKNLKIFSEPR